jgi:hypothetical protein
MGSASNIGGRFASLKPITESCRSDAKAVEGYRTPRREAFSGAQWFRQVLECASPLALFPEGPGYRNVHKKSQRAECAAIRVHWRAFAVTLSVLKIPTANTNRHESSSR